jgi:hypothetical protein
MRGDGGMGSMSKKKHKTANPLRTYPVTHEFSSPTEGHHEKIKAHIMHRRPGGKVRTQFGQATEHPSIAKTEDASSPAVGGHAANANAVMQHRFKKLKNRTHSL